MLLFRRFLAVLALLLVLSAAQAQPAGPPPTGPLYVEGRVVEHRGETVLVRTEDGDVVAQTHPELPAPLGSRVQLYSTTTPDGQGVYYVTDHVRRPVLYLLFLAFLLIAALVGRGKGIRAVLGMLLSLAVIMLGVVPAILAGFNPAVVALLGSVGILLLSVYFVHGLNWTTSAALLGTVVTSALTIGLASLVARLAHLRGVSDDDTLALTQLAPDLDLGALFLGGVIIGALGAIVDSTIPQAAVVRELAHLQPQQRWRQLYATSMRVGLDHVGSLINTLVLAYAGASLPLFVLLTLGPSSWQFTLNSELVASAVVQTLVGTIGLMLAVPLTSLIAALAFEGGRGPAPTAGEGHHHHH